MAKYLFVYKGQEVEILNMCTYLGITIQRKLTFTQHIRNRKMQTIRVINSLNLHRLTIENAFKSKDKKKDANYALQKISPLLTFKQIMGAG